MSKTVSAPKVKPTTPPATPPTTLSPAGNSLIADHLRWGWWCLLIFLTFGIVLEGLHGFKAASYLGVSNETRRLLWTLAHANGTLLAVINIGFAFSLAHIGETSATHTQFASKCLYAATLLVPAGFFLGGAFHYSGTPGIGIWLVPTGGVLVVVSAFLTARSFKPKSSG